MASYLVIILDSRPNPSAFLAWFGCLCGIYIFGQGVFLLRQKRRGGNGTACPIAAVRAGSLQITGSVEGEPHLRAPVSGKACFYYRSTVWRQEDADLDDSWVRAAEETMSGPFVVNDATGRILVEPRGAVVTLPHDTYEEYGKTLLATHTDIPANLEKFLARHKVNTEAALRVEESLLVAGSDVFVTGLAKINQQATPAPQKIETIKKLDVKRDAELSVSSNAPQVVRLSSAAHPMAATEMTMQSRVAAALSLSRGVRPDQPSASGFVAPGTAIAVAPRAESRSELPEEALTPRKGPTETVAPPAFVVCRPPDSSSFTISHRGEPAVEAPSGTRAKVFLLTGPVLTVVSIYFLLLTFGWL